MKWIVRILQGLLVVMFFMTGFVKLAGDPVQAEAFTEIYGYGIWFMYVVGVIEVIAAFGLLIGFWKKQFVVIFSALLILVMAGAVFTHLQAGQEIQVATLPFVLLLMAAVVFLGQRRLNGKAA
ncbi:DoxX family protein [Planococcus sp. YIM B11945]|uniref:DoxX family protein n=1 Tax=Planococcus sp. YIM B11945 TaxID=3435410 RepID=UPI003D7DA1E0